MDAIKASLFDALVFARRESADMSMAGSFPLYVTHHASGFLVSQKKPWGGEYYMARASRLLWFPANSEYVDGYEINRVRLNMVWGSY